MKGKILKFLVLISFSLSLSALSLPASAERMYSGPGGYYHTNRYIDPSTYGAGYTYKSGSRYYIANPYGQQRFYKCGWVKGKWMRGYWKPAHKACWWVRR